MLIHNRFRPSSSSTQYQDNDNPLQPTAIAEEPLSQEIVPGCFACGKCYVCKMGYLTPSDSFTSYHTTQVFSIGKRIACQSTRLIYLAECITCESSCVGYSISNLPNVFLTISLIFNVMSNHVGLPMIFLKKIMIWLGIKIKKNLINHLLSMLELK